MDGSVGPFAVYELRAFRFKPGIPGIGESMRVTHFAVFPACERCHTTRCDCLRPDTITMLCGAQYERHLLDEIVRGDHAGMPHIFCHARATQLEPGSVTSESSVAMVVDGVVDEVATATVPPLPSAG